MSCVNCDCSFCVKERIATGVNAGYYQPTKESTVNRDKPPEGK